MKNSIISVIIILFSINSYSQLKLTEDGRFGIGTLTPTTWARLHVSHNGIKCVWLEGSGLPRWSQTITSNVNHTDVMSYVVRNTTDRFYVNGLGDVYSHGVWISSDSIFKRNIQKIYSPLNKVTQLQGVTYNYAKYETLNDLKRSDVDVDKKRVLGLIAQDVEKVLPEAVKTMEDSSKAINYSSIVALLIEAIKEQQKQVESLQTIVYSQEQDIINLKEKAIKTNTEVINSNYNTISQLYNNIPNPFKSDTEINFYISKNAKVSRLIIHDLQGIEIKSFEIYQKGKSSITIKGSELKAGMYLYTLLVDDKVIDTKRMILSK